MLETRRRRVDQLPQYRIPHIPKGVQRPTGRKDRISRYREFPLAMKKELRPPLKHVKPLIFPIVDVRRGAPARWRLQIESRIAPFRLDACKTKTGPVSERLHLRHF